MGDGDDKTAIVCADWSEQQLMFLPGNRTAECLCGRPVVISREGRQLKAAEPDAEILCFNCALKRAPDAAMIPVPGAIERARSYGVDPSPAVRAARDGMTVREFIESSGGARDDD